MRFGILTAKNITDDEDMRWRGWGVGKGEGQETLEAGPQESLPP